MSDKTCLDVHDPYCDAPTGKAGSMATRCGRGIIVRDTSRCGALKPCILHGGEFPDEEDVPPQLRRELLHAAGTFGISYYYLTAIYRKGYTDAKAQQ